MHQSASGSQFATYLERDPHHYDFDTVRRIVQGTRLRAEQRGKWGNPKDRKMVFFEKM